MSDPLIIVDNSTLTAMATCPTQAAIRYALGLTTPDDRAPLRAGTLAHAVLAQHLSGLGGVLPLEIAEIATYIEFATGALEPTDRLYHENIIKVMRRWLDTHPVSGLPFRVYPELIEVGFAVPLADDVLFVGRLDGLVQDASGAWWVLEHKSTGRLDEIWRRRFKTSAQITGYVWAAQQHLKEPVSGCFVNGIEFGRLPTDVKKCRTHGVPYAECGTLHAKFDMLIEHRAPHQLEAWKSDAVKLARRFRSLKEQVGSLEDVSEVAAMTGQFTNACGFCQFVDYCAVGRPPATGRLMFNHEPWSPYDHAFAPRG